MTDQIFAEPVARLSGKTRERAGVYAELGFSNEHGITVEKFLYCTQDAFAQEKFNLNPRGVTLIEVERVFHILDWIGAIHYPNVADFIEEIRRFGLSRRLELSTKDYEKLTPDSRIVCVHPAGFIANTEPYWGARIGFENEYFESYNWGNCPVEIDDHMMTRKEALTKMRIGVRNLPMCMGLWYEDCMFIHPIAPNDRRGIRITPSFKYRCASPPNGKRMNLPGVIGSFPIGRIAVVEDPEKGEHEKKMEKLKNLHDDITVNLVKL